MAALPRQTAAPPEALPLLSSQVIVPDRRGPHARLVAYKLRATAVWDEEWAAYSPSAVREVMEYYRRFPVLHRTLLRHLPRDGEVIEAGSGLGHWVALLREAGIAARGVDLSAEALARAREVFPGLPFDEGDVRTLPFADASLAGYVSFGVAEHFEEGPEAVLREAARVVRDGGVMVVSVPWLSPLRRLQRVRPSGPPEGAAFYQYFFTRDEMVAAVEASGFDVVAWDGYGTLKTLRDEWSALRARGRPPRARPAAAARAPRPAAVRPAAGADFDGRVGLVRALRWGVHNALLENAPLHRVAAHMLLLVARRRPRLLPSRPRR
jgi:SAM-dependent methyltransferase